MLEVAQEQDVTVTVIRLWWRKRLLVLTAEGSAIANFPIFDEVELIGTSNLCRDHKMQADVIMFCLAGNTAQQGCQYDDFLKIPARLDLTNLNTCIQKVF